MSESERLYYDLMSVISQAERLVSSLRKDGKAEEANTLQDFAYRMYQVPSFIAEKVLGS